MCGAVGVFKFSSVVFPATIRHYYKINVIFLLEFEVYFIIFVPFSHITPQQGVKYKSLHIWEHNGMKSILKDEINR